MVNRDPFIEYSRTGSNISIYHSDFKLDEGNAFNKEGLSLMRKKEFKKAKKNFIKALEIEPNNAVILNNLGRIEFEEFNFDVAIEYFQKSLVVSDSSYTLAGHNLGETYGLIGEDEKSEEIYNFTILISEIDFIKGISQLNLAIMYLDYGKIDQCRIALNQAKIGLAEYNDFHEDLDYLEYRIEHYYD